MKPEVFVQIDRSASSTQCATDSDCGTGQKCGLEYPDDLKNYSSSAAKPAYCGTPLGYYTVTQICSLGGVSSDLQTMFQCNNTANINLTAPGGSSLMVCSNDFYQCNTQGAWADGYYNGAVVDSCYNYTNKPFSTSGFCCGCIDWEGVPTDNSVSCATQPSSTEHTTTQVFPSTEWLSLVKPKLKWLVDGCPDAYEYQYGDKHGTIQCSTVNPATTPGNAMNYKITFCPQGRTLFTGTTTASIMLSKPDATVLSDTNASIHWTVTPNPTTGSYSSTVRLADVSGSTKTCSGMDCNISYTNLTAATKYLAIVEGSITVNGTTVNAVPRYVNFTTDSQPPNQTVTIENEQADALSTNSISASWDVSSTPPVAVSSSATITQASTVVLNTQNCNTSHCSVNFSGLSSNTSYEIQINASGGGATATPKFVYAKTKSAATGVVVPVPSKGDMNLSNVLGPGAYCRPTTFRFPLLNTCQSGQRNGYRCVNEDIDGETIGEWYINQSPTCLSETNYSFESIRGSTAFYQGGNVSFTFYPNSPWQCTSQGSSLTCTKA